MEKEIKCQIAKVFKKNKIVTSEEKEVETVAVVRLDPEAAYVTVSTDRSFTLGLPNYCSAKASVFISVPCPLDEDQIEQAYQFVTDFCETKLAAINAELKG